MNQYHIYGIGAALVDTEVEVSDEDLADLAIEKGVMTLVEEQRQHQLSDYLSDHLVASKRASGGSGANTIIAASYFGANTFYSCKVANDENGEFYLNDLRRAQVDYPHNYHKNGADPGITGKCLVLITPDAERTMNTFLGISETISIRELHEDAIANSQYAYIEGYLVSSESGRAAAIKLREVAQQNRAKIALSLSDPAMVKFFQAGLKEMIGPGVDLLFCNQAEALGFTGTDTIDAAAAALQHYTKTFAITRGAEGSLVFNGEKLINVPPHTVNAVDTNGAGDMYAGAFLYALTQGYDFAQAGRLASLASATVVSQFGPRLRAEQHAEILRQIFPS